MMRKLTEKEATVLFRTLDSVPDKKIAEELGMYSEELGYQTERVRQIRLKAIRKIKAYFIEES